MKTLSTLFLIGLAASVNAWEYDFVNSKPSFNIYAENYDSKACYAEYAVNPQTGKQALHVICDTSNRGWMHVYNLEAKSITPFKYGKCTINFSTTGPQKIFQFGMRPMDRDNETFYYYQPVRLNKAGQWSLEFYINNVNTNYQSVVKHGPIANGVMDFPLNGGMGVTFSPMRDSGICDFFLESVHFQEIEEKDMPPVFAKATTYDEVEKQLAKFPPRCEDIMSRTLALSGLDTLLMVADSEDSDVVGNYYNKRVKKVIDEIKAWNSPVPKLWKLYSSGILVKAAGKVLAFDVNCGVEWEYTSKNHRRFKLNLSDENLEALTDLIDRSYHTHEHSDHTGYDLLQKLVAKKKLVFMTGNAIKYYKCENYPNVIRAENHCEPGYWVFDSTQNMGTYRVQNTAFVVELVPGTNLLVRGDIYEPPEVVRMCDYFQAHDAYAHYASVSPGAGILPEAYKRWNTFIMSAHEWEFTHRKRGEPGVACQSFSGNYSGIYSPYVNQGCGEVLSWGESIELTPRDEIPQTIVPWMKSMHYSHYFNNYRRSITNKIYLKTKGAAPATSLDQAMELIKTIHDLTGGIHQIIYLVGWQYDGHDSKYPSWGEAGPQCRSSFSDDPRESLRAMMREARKKYNTDVSLHINMNDAYENSPDWTEYLEKDAIIKNADGSLRKGGVWGGEQCYLISHTKELKAGLAQKRILKLLEYLPELKDAQTIHIDAFFAVESPFDKITLEQDKESMFAIVDFWHEQGIDVTTEFIASYDHIGYFPLVYHNNLNEMDRLMYPPELIYGGDASWAASRNGNFYKHIGNVFAPSSGCRYSEPWGNAIGYDLHAGNLKNMDKFIDDLFTRPVLSRYYGQFKPVKFSITDTEYTVEYTNEVKAIMNMATNRLTVTEQGRLVVDDHDIFITLQDNDGKPYLLAYSQDGMKRSIVLPPTFAKNGKLTARNPLTGEAKEFVIMNGNLLLTLAPHEVLILK